MTRFAKPKPSRAGSPAPVSRWETRRRQGHSVQFYEHDSFLIEELSRFIGRAVLGGDVAVIIATPEHCESLEERLAAMGLDLSVAIRQGRFLELDAAATLEKFMVAGWPDASLFQDVVGSAITRVKTAGGNACRVAAFGEMVALLWADGKREAAIRLEQLWNQLANTHQFQLHCAYPMHLFSAAADELGIQNICAQHSHIAPADPYANLRTEADRLRAIALLQQKAQLLEREIRDREEAQAALARHEVERRQAEDARRHLAAIVESSDDAIASKDLNGIVTSWNRSAERLFGYTAEEIVGRPILLIIPPELHHDEEIILTKIRRGEKIDHFETVRLTKDGRRVDVSLTISPVKDETGRVIGAAKIARDITQTKKIERALRMTEKLAAAGKMAATVAHEINNPLEAVTNLIYLAKRDLRDNDQVRQYLELANRELDRVAHIARQTLGFYRDTTSPVVFNVNHMVEGLLSLYEKKFDSRGIRVIRQYEADVEIKSLAGEVRQALSNLITNSIDAMPDGGSLIVRISRVHERKSGLPGVRITILDTGTGIPREHRKNLFQPFFTTKEDVGTGLGLWITRSIVEKNGGLIQMKSRTGEHVHGTAFSIYLPLDRPAADAATTGASAQ